MKQNLAKNEGFLTQENKVRQPWLLIRNEPQQGVFAYKVEVGLSRSKVNFIDRDGLDGEKASSWALSQIGKDDWEYWSPHPESRGKFSPWIGGRKSYKCNAFVWDALKAGGDPPGRMPDGRIPSAAEWGDPKATIPGYYVVPPGSSLQRGDVIGDGVHSGIYYPIGTKPETISAPPSDPVIQNDWGFRPGQDVTVRRCECDQ